LSCEFKPELCRTITITKTHKKYHSRAFFHLPQTSMKQKRKE
jgi:hypothetical protein